MRSLKKAGALLCMLLLAWPATAADLHLASREASLAGGKARYDGADNFRCIRGWTSTNITATWKCRIPTRGTWRVYITYACPPEIAGSEFELKLGDQKVNGIVASTERWENYKEMDLGPVIFRLMSGQNLDEAFAKKIGDLLRGAALNRRPVAVDGGLYVAYSLHRGTQRSALGLGVISGQ